MRTGILFLFCLVALTALAYADGGRGGGKGGTDDNNDREVGRKGGKNNIGDNDKEGGRRRGPNKVKKGPNGPKKEKKRPDGPKKITPNKKTAIKRTGAGKPGRKVNKKCPGECVTGNCQGVSKGRGGCKNGETCCVKRTRAGETDIKRFCKPLDLCTAKKGECRKRKTGCKLDEKRYRNKGKKQFCDKKSCQCCVQQCSTKRKCKKTGGSCMLKKEAKKNCDGIFTTSTRYCNGKKCGCCIPNDCEETNSCAAAGGQCQPKGAPCEGGVSQKKDDNGDNYCGKKCRCCIPGPTICKNW